MTWKSESQRHSLAKKGVRTGNHKLIASGKKKRWSPQSIANSIENALPNTEFLFKQMEQLIGEDVFIYDGGHETKIELSGIDNIYEGTYTAVDEYGNKYNGIYIGDIHFESEE